MTTAMLFPAHLLHRWDRILVDGVEYTVDTVLPDGTIEAMSDDQLMTGERTVLRPAGPVEMLPR